MLVSLINVEVSKVLMLPAFLYRWFNLCTEHATWHSVPGPEVKLYNKPAASKVSFSHPGDIWEMTDSQ